VRPYLKEQAGDDGIHTNSSYTGDIGRRIMVGAWTRQKELKGMA
jgi:hypothetical protein